MSFILFFDKMTLADIAYVGGKNASLGQMITALGNQVKIPYGFAVTADAYWHYVQENKLDTVLQECMPQLTSLNQQEVHNGAARMRTALEQAHMPDNLRANIAAAYKELCAYYNVEQCAVAVRSSATAEDLPTASFAGQQDSFLHIKGIDAVIESYKKCVASLFNERAVVYRNEQGFAHDKVALSVGIQKMVHADKACSGVLFTLDTESGFKDVIVINASYGLGESIVQGIVNPDEFMVYKPTNAIIKKKVGSKQVQIVYSSAGTQEVPVSPEKQNKYTLTDAEIVELAQYAQIIENCYARPMDIEWAKNADDNRLYIVQARPETIHGQASGAVITKYECTAERPKILVQGQALGQKMVTGIARKIDAANGTTTFNKGDILVAPMTDPDWVPLMKIAGGIVTDLGGRTCHAAIVSRELGLPAVIGTTTGTQVIADGQMITLDCSQGSNGFVYDGAVPFEKKEYKVGDIPKAPCDILINLADPDKAFEYSFLPVQGVGLARLEFIINTMIKVHPMAIADFENIKDTAVRAAVQKISAAYTTPQEFFIDSLSCAIGQIAAAFSPKKVVVRLTDFKSNEYRDLIGGNLFEPVEENPMLGFRGAFRYRSEQYAPAFALECAALKRVRNEMRFTNVVIMVPFVRTVDEAQKTVELLAIQGLKRGENGLKLYMMVEIPSNVILLEQFAPYFDGFSIGSNDLTQLTLGVDRDSGILTPYFDERDPAVIALLKLAIQKARTANKEIGICGQAPSDFPEIAQLLIDEKINYLSLNPDSVLSFLMRNKVVN